MWKCGGAAASSGNYSLHFGAVKCFPRPRNVGVGNTEQRNVRCWRCVTPCSLVWLVRRDSFHQLACYVYHCDILRDPRPSGDATLPRNGHADHWRSFSLVKCHRNGPFSSLVTEQNNGSGIPTLPAPIVFTSCSKATLRVGNVGVLRFAPLFWLFVLDSG